MEKRTLALLLVSGSLFAAEPTPLILPDAIRNQLNAEYPGWKFSPVTPEVQKNFIKHVVNHPPSFLAADFDGNGEMDYAVQILIDVPGKVEQIILAFVKGMNTYEESVLESRGPNPDVYLGLRKKNILIIMGTETGDTNYRYADGRFSEYGGEN